MAEEILSNILPAMTKENPSEVKAVITEAKSSDITSNLVEETCQDVKSSVTAPVMSDEEKDVLDIHEITKLGVKASRRFSTGITGTAGVKIQVQPRYLGHSVSSCHDLCKYGVKQDSVLKPWKIMRNKKTDVQSRGEDVDKKGDIAIAMVGKKLGAGLRLIPGSKAELPDKSMNIEKHSLAAKKPIIPVKSSGFKEIGVAVKCCNDLQSSEGASSGKTSIKVGKKFKGFEESAADLSVSKKVEMRISSRVKDISLRNEKKGVISPSVSSSPKLTLKMVTKINPKNTKGVSLSQELNNVEISNSSLVNIEEVEEKILHVVESSIRIKSLKDAQCKIQEGSSSSSSGKINIRRGQNDLIAHKQSQSLPSSPEIKGTARTESRLMRQNSKLSSSRPSLNEQKEKSLLNSLNPDVISPIDNNKWSRRSGIKLTPTLSFKTGKVVDSKPVDSSPRRLKFRRRVVQENPVGKGDERRINLNRTQNGDGKASNTEIKQEKVELRHRKVEGKKKTQTLFNNVIEETASKLAEVRKSKVKALVGAFETVISLQDNKSSPRIRRRSGVSAAKG